MDHTWVPVASVIVDDMRKRDLGDLEPLMESIATHGLMHPIVLSRQNRLISGWRRLAATMKLGKRSIEAHFVDDAVQAFSLIDGEGINPDHFKPMVWSERVAFGLVVEDLDYQRNEVVQSNARRKAADRRWNREPTVAYGEKQPSTSQIIADLLGCTLGLWRVAREVYLTAHDRQADGPTLELAKRAVEYMDQSEQPNGARAMLLGKGHRLLKDPMQVSRTASSTEVRNVFNGAAPVLEGLVTAFRQIEELPEDLTEEEVARWLTNLSRTRKELEKLIKKLRRIPSNG